jgi:hypothetical protein
MKKNSILMLAFLMVFGGFHSVFAQFPIKIPKVPKIEKPKQEQPRNEEREKPATENINRNPSASGSVQEKLLRVKPSSVGRIYFSDKPFGATNEGSKTSFTTGDYIYGRFETGGKTLREAFGFAPIIKENPEHKLIFNLYVYGPYAYSVDGYRTEVSAVTNYPFVIFTEADLDKTYWNFDVLPDPAKTTTRVADSDYFKTEAEDKGSLALYKFLKQKAEEKTYTVGIELVKRTTDFRGNPEPEEKWLTVEGRLPLQFKTSDFAKIKADQEKMEANRVARIKQGSEDSKKAAIENEPLPKAWTLKSSPLLPGLTEANLKEMFLRDHPYWVQKQIIKLYAEPANATVPTIVNNELGIPKYRYLRQSFVAFVKVVGENKCFYQRFTPAQPYSGGGTFGGFYAILDDRINISCEKMGVK